MGDRLADSITPDEILFFLTKLTDRAKQTTKHNRYSSLKAFFNYIKNSIDPNFQNPCETPILRKIFKDRKITLPDPKSEKESEVVFITQKVADRLKYYIKEKGIEPEQRIFPITYNAVRVMVSKAGKIVGVNLLPHDLRRFCATHASRAWLVLHHAHLSTTQRYLGKISDTEALKSKTFTGKMKPGQ